MRFFQNTERLNMVRALDWIGIGIGIVLLVPTNRAGIAVRIIWSKMIAFARYKLRSCAEFAKEALADQDLGNGEMVNIRWAHDDPNPTAKVAQDIRVKQQAATAIIQKYQQEGVPEYLYKDEGSFALLGWIGL